MNQLIWNLGCELSPKIVSFCGPANTGKSTLFYLLAQEELFKGRIGAIAGYTKFPLVFTNSRWKDFILNSEFLQGFHRAPFQGSPLENSDSRILEYFFHPTPLWEDFALLDTPDINTAFFNPIKGEIHHANRQLSLEVAFQSQLVLLVLTPQTYADREVMLFTQHLLLSQRPLGILFNFLDSESDAGPFIEDFSKKIQAEIEFSPVFTLGIKKCRGEDREKELKKQLEPLRKFLIKWGKKDQNKQINFSLINKDITLFLGPWGEEFQALQKARQLLFTLRETCIKTLLQQSQKRIKSFFDHRLQTLFLEQQKSLLTKLFQSVSRYFSPKSLLEPPQINKLAEESFSDFLEEMEQFQSQWITFLEGKKETLPFKELKGALLPLMTLKTEIIQSTFMTLDNFRAAREEEIKNFVDKEIPSESIWVKQGVVLVIFIGVCLHDGGMVSGPLFTKWIGAHAILDKLNDPTIRDSIARFIQDSKQNTEKELFSILTIPLEKQIEAIEKILIPLEENIQGYPDTLMVLENL